MKKKNEFPPNYQFIKDYLPLTGYQPIFCFGDTIYNPHKVDIPEDLEWHEMVHSQQQGGKPDEWWIRYCTDAKFRLEQETEAFARQWLFVKKHIPKATKDALDDFASILSSSLYTIGMSSNQCKTLIRLTAQSYGTEKI